MASSRVRGGVRWRWGGRAGRDACTTARQQLRCPLISPCTLQRAVSNSLCLPTAEVDSPDWNGFNLVDSKGKWMFPTYPPIAYIAMTVRLWGRLCCYCLRPQLVPQLPCTLNFLLQKDVKTDNKIMNMSANLNQLGINSQVVWVRRGRAGGCRGGMGPPHQRMHCPPHCSSPVCCKKTHPLRLQPICRSTLRPSLTGPFMSARPSSPCRSPRRLCRP